jgi:hypothetical protein
MNYINEDTIKELDIFSEPVETTVDPRDLWLESCQKRIGYCGYLQIQEHPESGTTSNRIFLCGEPDCHYCGPKTRREMTQALRQSIQANGGSLRRVIVKTAKERAQIVRKYGGKQKVSASVNDILLEDGTVTTEIEILIATDDEIGEPFADFDESFIERWAQKSFSRAKSGMLHKLDKEVKPAIENKTEDIFDPSEAIKCESWTVDCRDENILEQVEQDSLNLTKHLNPQSFIELKQAMIERRTVRKRLLEKRNIVILDIEIYYLTVRKSRIKWKNQPNAPD